MSRMRERLLRLEAAASQRGRGQIEVARHIVQGTPHEREAEMAAIREAAPGIFHVFRVIIPVGEAVA